MGKGDLRTRRGKIRRGTSGKTHPKHGRKVIVAEFKPKETKTRKK
jgi:ribosomal small subunit protein bTHX